MPPVPHTNISPEPGNLSAVANLTPGDGHAFLAVAPKVPVHSRTTVFSMEDANAALAALRSGGIEGAAVLMPPHPAH